MTDLGTCDVAFCTRAALTVLVGESGDFHLCAIHQPRSPYYDKNGAVRCCLDDCCGPGSYCCNHALPHSHEDDE